MNSSSETSGDILPPTPIRVETALSRYPVHRLAKHGNIAIDIREKNESGEVSIKWEVNHIPKFGQPGPMAYKLDTLIINRRIEEASRPIPRVIRLGSLREIYDEISPGYTGNTSVIKRSLHQNSSTYISAKISYRQSNGTEQTLEAGFHRYDVVLTGEELPDGRKADAVHIVLSDIYIKIINGAMTRPLDYDYIKSLPPGPQRFYELLSYQMYAAIKNDRPRAKLLYSEFCTYAPMTRYLNFDQVKKQMYKIHSEHRKSGYIAKIDHEQTVDADGRPDWIMLYQPGPKALADHRAFTKRGGPVMLEVELFTADPVPQTASSQATSLESALIRRGITPAIARQLVAEHGEEAARAQIEHLEWQIEKKPGKIADPAAWLVSAIKTGHAAPKGFVSTAERQRREEAKQAKERLAVAERRRQREEEAEDRRQKELVSGYWNGLTKEQQAEHDASAIAQADAEELKLIEAGPMKRFGMTILRDKLTRKMFQAEGKLPAAKA